MPNYFVKDSKIHKYFGHKILCPVKYTGEKMLSNLPNGYQKCDLCFPQLKVLRQNHKATDRVAIPKINKILKVFYKN